jgi:hypothetical protein
MGSDELIDFESDNWDWLAEKFIGKYRNEWEDFIYKEYENSMPDFMED